MHTMAAAPITSLPPLPRGRFEWERRGEWIEDPDSIMRTACAKYTREAERPLGRVTLADFDYLYIGSRLVPTLALVAALVVGWFVGVTNAWDEANPSVSERLNSGALYGVSVAESERLPPPVAPQ